MNSADSPQKGKHFFFQGLNEIRAIAALCVIFHHLELYCFREKRSTLYHIDFLEYFITSIGKNGVYLFFVLSGFLITFLLLKEKERHTSINIKNFYMRRVFRIWPLYFIIVFISFVLVPALVFNTDFFNSETYYMSLINNGEGYTANNTLLYILFLSNFAIPVVAGAQSWSVSVEEQFYVIWPQLLQRFSNRNMLAVFILLIIGIVGYEVLHLPYYEYLKKMPIEIMAIGGIFAYIFYYYKDALDKYLKNNWLFLLNLLLIGICLFVKVPKFFVAPFFGTAILFIITDRKFNLRSKTLAFLGTISYGIYMYHPMMMFISSATANKFFLGNDMPYKIVFYLLTVGLTIVVSHLSYTLVERKLINFKDKKFSDTK